MSGIMVVVSSLAHWPDEVRPSPSALLNVVFAGSIIQKPSCQMGLDMPEKWDYNRIHEK
jgi:hypothetical protein